MDADGTAACFTVPSVILDGLAPHVWSGPSAPADWVRDALAEAEHIGASDFRIELQPPLHNAVTGDAAYFAAPATMSFKVRGQAMTQTDGLQGAWCVAD